jgi:hypothetical protein
MVSSMPGAYYLLSGIEGTPFLRPICPSERLDRFLLLRIIVSRAFLPTGIHPLNKTSLLLFEAVFGDHSLFSVSMIFSVLIHFVSRGIRVDNIGEKICCFPYMLAKS